MGASLLTVGSNVEAVMVRLLAVLLPAGPSSP